MGSDGLAVGLDQGQVIALGGELEVGVQFPAGLASVFVGGEDQQVTVADQVGGGELPLPEVAPIIREIPTAELRGFGAAVVNLDPVGELPVGVAERAPVGRHELSDEEAFRREGFRSREDGPGDDRDQQEKEGSSSQGAHRCIRLAEDLLFTLTGGEDREPRRLGQARSCDGASKVLFDFPGFSAYHRRIH